MKRETKCSYNELIAQYCEGRVEAMEELFSRLSVIVLRWIRDAINDEEEISDLHQDVLLHIWIKLRNGLYHEGYFMGWLRILVCNYLCSYHRKKKQWFQYGGLENINIEADEDALYYEELLSKLITMFSELSVMHQELMKMRYWRAMSYREIAHYTGIKHSTVVKRIKSGCSQLKGKMNKLGYSEP